MCAVGAVLAQWYQIIYLVTEGVLGCRVEGVLR